MSQPTNVKPGTPSKNADNQDAATLTQSQPSTTEELQARVDHDGDSPDQAGRITDEAMPKTAR